MSAADASTVSNADRRPDDAVGRRRETAVLGMRLSSPLIVGSGPITDSENKIRRAHDAGAGAVVTKTIFRGSQASVKERIALCETGALNSTLYSVRSIDEWLISVNNLVREGVRVIPNIFAESPDELADLARLTVSAGCAALELGISCPNDGTQQANNVRMIQGFTSAVRNVVDVPLSVKLAACDGVLMQAKGAVEAGADAISLSDTIPGFMFDVSKRRFAFEGPAGYSGAGIKPIVLHSIHQMRAAGMECEVIGIGGVRSAEDILEYLHVGADAVQAYTVFMGNDMRLAGDINRDLDEWLVEHRTAVDQILRDRSEVYSDVWAN